MTGPLAHRSLVKGKIFGGGFGYERSLDYTPVPRGMCTARAEDNRFPSADRTAAKQPLPRQSHCPWREQC
jgi:hypothetical protein